MDLLAELVILRLLKESCVEDFFWVSIGSQLIGAILNMYILKKKKGKKGKSIGPSLITDIHVCYQVSSTLCYIKAAVLLIYMPAY